MEVFFSLLLKIIPLYILIALGYIAGKALKIQKETIASLLIYIILPVVVFTSILKTSISAELLLLPMIFFAICCLMCLLFYFIGNNLFKDNTKNILAFTAGSGNTGYFGVPVSIALFGEDSLGIVILCILGFTFFENSLGFFITARGNHTASEAVVRLLKLPTIYAFSIALLLNIFGTNLGDYLASFSKIFIGSYTVLGMMLIGFGLADMKGFKSDLKFIFSSLTAKFIVWPLLILAIIFLDNNYFGLFNDLVHQIMFLLSIVPLAANTVAFATELKVHPEKASLAVFISTIIALVYIPLLTTILFK